MLLSYPANDSKTPQSSLTFYSHQKVIQMALLFIAVLCIPWLLLGKPIYIIIQNKKKQKNVNDIFHFVYLFLFKKLPAFKITKWRSK
jgi:hypothetical protein